MEQQLKPTVEKLRSILARIGLAEADRADIRAFTCAEDGTEYAVWLVETEAQKTVLKRAKAYELACYENFFSEPTDSVPALLGACRDGDVDWFLTEYCEGEDLRRCDTKRLLRALDALIALQDRFWQREDLYDCCIPLEKGLKAAKDRGRYLGSERLERVYADFLRIYQETPRTLCHEDLLPINVLVGETRAVLIDWEHAGMLPYMGAFARLIAHGREREDAYFYLTEADRALAIDYYFEHLIKPHGIAYETYRKTLDYFLFFEYCEWIMLGNRYDGRDDARYGYYQTLANRLADRLLTAGDACETSARLLY